MIERARRLLRRKFVRDTLALQISKIVSAGVSFAASVVVVRLMQPSAFGEWALAASFMAMWQSFNLTGIGPSTVTRLAAAVGAQQPEQVLNLMAFYVRVALMWAAFSIAALALIGPPLASRLYTVETALLSASFFPMTLHQPEPAVGVIAALFAWALIPDAFYNLALIALQSRRSMQIAAVLENINGFMLAGCVVAALLVSPTAQGMLVGRLIYSYTTMLLALALYYRERTQGSILYPPLMTILKRARSVPLGPYWRFGFAIALDRSIANFFVQIPLQLVGIFAGREAAGYLGLAMRAINLPNTLASAIFDNMQTVVPQAIGRRDYANLYRNFNRVIFVLAVGAVGFYGAMVILVHAIGPAVARLLYGDSWLPAVPLLAIIALYGAVTTVGGVLGPLYRALELVWQAAAVKAVALAIGLPLGWWLVQRWGAAGGAWTIGLIFSVSIALTAFIALPVLRRRAQSQPLTVDQRVEIV